MKVQRQKYSVEFYEKCNEFMKQGHSLKECAEHFSIKYELLRTNLTKLGFRKPSRIGNKNKQVAFNEHYFDIIDSDKKAYFLGFLMSDGYICKTPYSWSTGIALQLQDMYILEEFAKDINFTNKLNIYKNSAKLVLTGSKHLYETLVKYGFHEEKSHSNYTMPELPREFIHSFIRGYFDGDGCITIKATSYSVASICCNSQMFLKSLQDTLELFEIYNTHLREESTGRKNPIYILYISRSENQKAFKEFIYNDAEIKLLRKYEKFCKIPS